MLLNRRYKYDKKPLEKLNKLQEKTKLQIDNKVIEGIYTFEETICPICNSINFEILSFKDRYGLYMPVSICKDCGLIQTNPRMTEQSYVEFYKTEYRRLYGGKDKPTSVFFKDQYYKGERIYNFIIQNGKYSDLKNMSVLEVGCGAGGILLYFREMGCHIKGIDLNESYIEFGKRNYHLNLYVGDIHSIDTNEHPDLIIYSDVIEHILAPNIELKQIHKILSNNGQLYIETPSVKNLRRSCKMDFLRYLQNAHVYHFSQISLTNLFYKNGFEPMRINEFINAIFIKSSKNIVSGKLINDFSEALEYLYKAEKSRIIYLFSPKNIAQIFRSFFINSIKFFGFYDFLRDKYHSKK